MRSEIHVSIGRICAFLILVFYDGKDVQSHANTSEGTLENELNTQYQASPKAGSAYSVMSRRSAVARHSKKENVLAYVREMGSFEGTKSSRWRIPLLLRVVFAPILLQAKSITPFQTQALLESLISLTSWLLWLLVCLIFFHCPPVSLSVFLLVSVSRSCLNPV